MPSAALRPCGPGCPVLVTHGRCPAHTRSQDRARGTTTERGYDSHHWKRLRERFLRERCDCSSRPSALCPRCLGTGLRNAWCGECASTGILERASQVDHIWSFHEYGPQLRLDTRNLQGLCASHHSAKTKAEMGECEFSEYQKARRDQALEELQHSPTGKELAFGT